MKAVVKLNPVRVVVPKFGAALTLAMEYVSKSGVLPTKVLDSADSIELVFPYTKHSIKHIQKYINDNL